MPKEPARLLLGLAPGLLAALGVLGAATLPVRLEPGRAAWRLAWGADAQGLVREKAVLVLPGLPRRGEAAFLVEAESAGGGPVSLGVAIDAGSIRWLRIRPGGPAMVPVPPARIPGLRLDLVPADGTGPVRLRSLTIRQPPPSAGAALAALLLVAAGTALLLRRMPPLAALALGLFAAGLLALAVSPALVYLTLPAPPSLARIAFVALPLGGGAALALLRGGLERGLFARGAALLAALVFGAWVRIYFLPSTGSWDTEYWKAWMLRASSHGVTRVYGDPGAVPAGRLLAQLRGEEELWKVTWGGRAFVVDYPPLAMALWRWSWWGVTKAAAGMDHVEAQSAAVKVPAVLGDVAAVAVLLWALRHRPRRALLLAALYWALPVSWLSSAVLGYLDGAVAPLAAAAVVAAGRGRAGGAGALVALAALIKPTALVIAPAVAVALVSAWAPLRRAAGAGLAVVGLVLLPFLLHGTLVTAIVHVYRILFQGTLSGGYANPWWLLGHALTVLKEGADLAGPVKFARIDLLAFPARSVGAGLFALAALFVAWRHRNTRGQGPAALAGAALVFAYGILAVGVHENHPHPLFLILLATGLPSRRLGVLALATCTVYVLNILALSGLGRFHGPRHAALEPFIQALAALRMGLGFDITLALAVTSTALFAWMLAHLRVEIRGLSEREEG